ncbi:OmpA family protein [Sphingomonas sp. ac-8]|uniref:OmpA family protein n=1 Tax=Sphingomonas sp. ac-8 TaxID=3242977 RepID=UPI003A7FB78C
MKIVSPFAGRWPLTLRAALLAASLGAAGCDRTPPVVNQLENAADDVADDLGIGDDPDEIRVHFAVGSAALTAEARSRLDSLARRYASRNDPGITVTGYSDTSGSAAANLALSRQRAAAVQAYLQDHGIAPGAFEIEARGERDPRIVTGNDVRERANRRVRITIDEQ